MTLTALYIWANQGERPATVLATIGPEALLEYEMPSGRSALRVVCRHYHRGSDPGEPYKNVSYRSLPKCWLLEIIRNGMDWIASPQQVPDLHETPREMLDRRWPNDGWGNREALSL